MLAGQPNDPSWASVAQSAFEELRSGYYCCKFPEKAKKHRRGDFAALSAGISYGGGQTVSSQALYRSIYIPFTNVRCIQAPGNLYHHATNSTVLRGLLSSEPFIRIAGFSSSAFATWYPKLHHYYDDHFNPLLSRHPDLRRNFKNSVWATVAFNFGPATVTAKHRDFANIPFGICSVTALGTFNPKKGGHMILWELKVVIEFPPGSTILLPSAVISHSNTPIRKHERRCSFTQYTPGGLIRWAEHGFQSETNFVAGLSQEQKKEVAAENAARCKFGVSLFSTLRELQDM